MVKIVTPGSFDSSKLKKILIISIVLIIVLSLLGRFSPLYSVEFGTVGVVSRFGRIERLASPGLNFRIPLIEKVFFTILRKLFMKQQNSLKLVSFITGNPADLI